MWNTTHSSNKSSCTNISSDGSLAPPPSSPYFMEAAESTSWPAATLPQNGSPFRDLFTHSEYNLSPTYTFSNKIARHSTHPYHGLFSLDSMQSRTAKIYKSFFPQAVKLRNPLLKYAYTHMHTYYQTVQLSCTHKDWFHTYIQLSMLIVCYSFWLDDNIRASPIEANVWVSKLLIKVTPLVDWLLRDWVLWLHHWSASQVLKFPQWQMLFKMNRYKQFLQCPQRTIKGPVAYLAPLLLDLLTFHTPSVAVLQRLHSNKSSDFLDKR